MLYHLISLNPGKDITLHVSTNNPAMVSCLGYSLGAWGSQRVVNSLQLLYNRFGFKAEGFVAGFYDKYLDAQSRLSKNAFLLRLRR